MMKKTLTVLAVLGIGILVTADVVVFSPFR
jgi:hypothetical protein